MEQTWCIWYFDSTSYAMNHLIGAILQIIHIKFLLYFFPKIKMCLGTKLLLSKAQSFKYTTTCRWKKAPSLLPFCTSIPVLQNIILYRTRPYRIVSFFLFINVLQRDCRRLVIDKIAGVNFLYSCDMPATSSYKSISQSLSLQNRLM